MKKVILATFFLLLCVIPCSAENLKGKLENINLTKQEMIVDGVTVKITKDTTLEGENKRGQVMRMMLRNMSPYMGRTAKCYGTKTGPTEFTATKVRVYEKR